MAWRDELSEAEQAKLAIDLQLWLDGAPSELYEVVEPRPGVLRIYARLAHGLDDTAAAELTALGVVIEPHLEMMSGTSTREQLMALARHSAVIGLAPIRRSSLSTLGDDETDEPSPPPNAAQRAPRTTDD